MNVRQAYILKKCADGHQKVVGSNPLPSHDLCGALTIELLRLRLQVKVEVWHISCLCCSYDVLITIFKKLGSVSPVTRRLQIRFPSGAEESFFWVMSWANVHLSSVVSPRSHIHNKTCLMFIFKSWASFWSYTTDLTTKNVLCIFRFSKSVLVSVTPFWLVYPISLFKFG